MSHLDFKTKCTKFDFSWGSALDPAREVYSAPQTPYRCMVLRGLLPVAQERIWKWRAHSSSSSNVSSERRSKRPRCSAHNTSYRVKQTIL